MLIGLRFAKLRVCFQASKQYHCPLIACVVVVTSVRVFVVLLYTVKKQNKRVCNIVKMADNSGGDPEKLELKMTMGFSGKTVEQKRASKTI